MQPFSHPIAEPYHLKRMVGLSVAVHLALIAGLVLAEWLAPPPIDFRDAIQVTLVPPSAPSERPEPSPDMPPPAPPIPKPPPPPPPSQARRDPVLAPLEDNPLWDQLDAPEDSDLARQFREMERAAERPETPYSEDLEDWWDKVNAAAVQAEEPVAMEEPAETPQAPSLRDAFEDIRDAQVVPEEEQLIGGELTNWLEAQIAMVLSPGDVRPGRATDVDQYQALVKRQVESHWSPPDLFRGTGAKALYEFVIERNGRIHGVKLLRSSGSAHFDDAAMRALLTSGPFPPLPEAIQAPSVKVTYLFEYKPKGAR